MIESANRRAGVTTCALVALAASACGDGTRWPETDPGIGMLDPGNEHHELSYSQWAAEYMKWQFQAPVSVLWDIKDCTVDQKPESPVVFLDEDLAARTEPRPCAISSEKAIFFPLLSVTLLDAASTYYTDKVMKAAQLHVDAGQVLEKDLKSSVEEFMGRLVVEEASIRVDGRAVRSPLSGGIQPMDYEYTPYPGDSLLFEYYGVPSADIPPVVSPAFVAGYWVLLAPLERGEHELFVSVRGHTGGNLQIFYDEFTYQLTLE